MGKTDANELLSRNPLFVGLPQAALDEVLLASKLRMVPARTVIAHQGDMPNGLMVLGKGIIKVSQMRSGGAPVTIHVLGPGDLVGVVAAFGRVPFPATATTVTDCVVLSWAATLTYDLMGRYPVIAMNALGYVSRCVEELVQRLGDMATGRVEQRLARALLRLADQVGLVAPEGVEIGYPLSRQDLAEIVGTDLYVVSRVLHAWAERGLIVAGRLRVVLCDRQRMEQVATEGR